MKVWAQNTSSLIFSSNIFAVASKNNCLLDTVDDEDGGDDGDDDAGVAGK